MKHRWIEGAAAVLFAVTFWSTVLFGQLGTQVQTIPLPCQVSAAPNCQHRFDYRSVSLLRVVDGDTVRLAIELEPYVWRGDQSCRLLRVDAPEINTDAGKKSAAALEEFLKGKALRVEMSKKDSFGRWLIELYADVDNVSDWLLKSGNAKPYGSS